MRGRGAAAGGATFRQSRKSFMPLKLRNISQLSGVSSVMFHSALQENSMTWSHCRQAGSARAPPDRPSGSRHPVRGPQTKPRQPRDTPGPSGAGRSGSTETRLTILSSSFF